MPDMTPEEKRDIARAMGQASLRVLVSRANPNLSAEDLRQKRRQSWSESGKDYTKAGIAALRQLEEMGYTFTKAAKS